MMHAVSYGQLFARACRVLGWVASGALRPLIDALLPWERVTEALTKLLNRQTIGRVILAIR